MSSDYNGADISCFGYSDGEIYSTDSNGVSAVLYEFNNSGILTATASWDSLSSGAYNIYAEDSNGCNTAQTVTLVDPSVLAANLTVVSNEYCNNMNGELEIIASGGTGALNYTWSDGQNTSIATGLVAGNYQCTILDANGCDTNLLGAVIDDVPFQIIPTSTPTCLGANQGTASVSLIPNGSYVLNNPYNLYEL